MASADWQWVAADEEADCAEQAEWAVEAECAEEAERAEEAECAEEGECAKEAECAEEAGRPEVRVAPEVYRGVIATVGSRTGNLLISSDKVRERCGADAIIHRSRNQAGAKVGDRVSFKIVEREGQRPVAVNVQVLGNVNNAAAASQQSSWQAGGALASRAGSKGKGGKGRDAQRPGVPCRDLYYVGVLLEQGLEEPHKCYIECEQISENYGCNAWFPLAEKPPALRPHGLLTFTVPRGGEVGMSPRAYGVAKLAPIGSLASRPKGMETVGQVSASSGPGVRRTIAKAQ